jgi:sugar phosphate isomerase/epimerase
VNRRTFLAALGALPLVTPPVAASERLGRIGLQLYTVRAAMASDLEATLARVAAIGYREVEFAGFFGRRPTALRRALADEGLRAPSAHVPFEELGRDWERIVADAGERGLEWIVAAWIPEEQRGGPDAWRRIADRLNSAGRIARAAGLRLAYHNHSYEFVRVRGALPYDLLLGHTDPSLVELEMDVFWLRRGGGDPLAYFARWPGRFPLLHLKDMDGTAERRMVDVGRGVIPWAAVLHQRRLAGVRHVFVEHDEAADPLASARASYAYLRRLRF